MFAGWFSLDVGTLLDASNDTVEFSPGCVPTVPEAAGVFEYEDAVSALPAAPLLTIMR